MEMTDIKSKNFITLSLPCSYVDPPLILSSSSLSISSPTCTHQHTPFLSLILKRIAQHCIKIEIFDYLTRHVVACAKYDSDLHETKEPLKIQAMLSSYILMTRKPSLESYKSFVTKGLEMPHYEITLCSVLSKYAR